MLLLLLGGSGVGGGPPPEPTGPASLASVTRAVAGASLASVTVPASSSYASKTEPK
jgi:hypothetical protein